ncbi:MAG TPA: hypothetical protein VGF79_12205 [Bacteroidia bacterium]
MRKLLVFCLCFIVFNLKAQNLPCDSCAKQNLQHLKDSSAKALQEKGEAVQKQAAEKLNSKSDAIKGKVKSQTDSAARNAYKQKAKGSFNSELNSVKSKPKSYWERAKSQLPPKDKLFKFGLTLRSDNYATTEQNPMIRSEKVYSRLYVTPSFTLLGLPFTSNFFFTTEANNTYKNNFFAIRFDVNAMRQMAAEAIQKEMDEAKKLDRLRQIDLQKNAMDTRMLENELDGLKSQLPDYDQWQNKLKQEAEQRTKDYVASERAKLEASIKDKSEAEKQRLLTEFETKKDSLLASKMQSLNDSLNAIKTAAGEKVDTAGMNKILSLQSKMNALKSKKAEIEKLRQIDSAGLNDKINQARNPNELKQLAKSKLPDKGMLQSLLSVDRFGIGLVNAQYSEFTLYAASVKGLDLGISKEKYFYDFTLGRTTTQFIGPFSSVNPSYDRNIAVVRAGLGKRQGDHLAFEYLYAFDHKFADSLSPMVRNGVLNINAKFNLLRSTTVEGNLAKSTYNEKYAVPVNVMKPAGKDIIGVNADMAYDAKLTQTQGENMKVELLFRQTGAAFRTVGNPFLRRNFREVELKYEQQFFKKKVKLTAGYKEMRDNLLELNAATNRLKGYTLKLSTHFEKYPNLTLSYSPYQQGNNHPDSLYRTNNQFSITSAMLTYKKRFKGLNWMAFANYTRSAMEISGRGPVAYRMINTVHNFQMGQRHSSMLAYLSNVTMPFVDSLNSNSVQFTHNYLLKKTTTLGLISEYTRYKNDALKAGMGLVFTQSVIKNLTLSLTARYDKVDKLWNLKNEDVFSGRVVVMWRW